MKLESSGSSPGWPSKMATIESGCWLEVQLGLLTKVSTHSLLIWFGLLTERWSQCSCPIFPTWLLASKRQEEETIRPVEGYASLLPYAFKQRQLRDTQFQTCSEICFTSAVAVASSHCKREMQERGDCGSCLWKI